MHRSGKYEQQFIPEIVPFTMGQLMPKDKGKVGLRIILAGQKQLWLNESNHQRACNAFVDVDGNLLMNPKFRCRVLQSHRNLRIGRSGTPSKRFFPERLIAHKLICQKAAAAQQPENHSDFHDWNGSLFVVKRSDFLLRSGCDSWICRHRGVRSWLCRRFFHGGRPLQIRHAEFNRRYGQSNMKRQYQPDGQYEPYPVVPFRRNIFPE